MCFYLRNWQVTFLLYTLGVFISEYIAKASMEPRDYRVVFLIQKEQMFLHLLSYFYLTVSTQLFINIAIVIGPTPPGTGVIALTLSTTSSKSTSPQSLLFSLR